MDRVHHPLKNKRRQAGPMKKLHGYMLARGLTLLVCLIWKIGIGQIWRQFTLLGWGTVPIVLGEGVAEFLHAVGWWHCLSGPQRAIPLLRLFRISLAGFAISYLTP